MNKQKLFLDYDGCLIDSITPFCKTYNDLYCSEETFVPAVPSKVSSWNAKEQIPLCKDINQLFGHDLFFEYATPLDEWTLTVLEEFAEKYELICCTIGVVQNIAKKAIHIQKMFPMIHETILLMQNQCKMDKSIICMNGSVFMDDVASNLKSSSAEIKICIGKKYDWNESWKGLRCTTWQSAGKLLL